MTTRAGNLLTLTVALAIIGAPCVTAEPQKKPKEDLPNFHQVAPYLYRGGEPTEKGLAEAKKQGVETIFDLRGTGPDTKIEKEEAEKLGLRYFNLPMDSHAPSDEYVDKFLHAVEEAKAANSGHAVYVHCQHGSDRTGCMVGVWRVTHDGWNYDKAYEEMRKYYFGPKFVNLSNTVRNYADGARKESNAK
ncbi:MAG TPA: dual specificity protein phosphatase family protein [Trichormus sp.]|jgi:protein tyrosine/serine phosphatase